ncbi:hypothetical protein JQC92_00965 [Shewanella sp. 202IG2-18]|uniref:hypothetical protein n=1 Tax=Parashewanella hymeniacidonis TaxID=2807618 RepID=UPI00195FBECB|nr:hypothetical protein [Parashewanella hymeniacidonis]MBM7070615.1 hypothetical protein [Parashewanella hymeniacidonis]
MKNLICVCFVLLLTHCASAPKPPHCRDDGKELKPVNSDLVKTELVKVDVDAPIHAKAREHHD